ncbi:MAG: hypothetical protein ACYS21_12800 [Planctomycetota bacterium]|jgi:hypothetical protein
MYGLRYTRFGIIHVLWLGGVARGAAVRMGLGVHLFGTTGLIAGGVMGLVVGHLAGSLPDWAVTRMLFGEIDSSSNSELRSIVAAEDWNFRHTMALLQLGARGEDVQSELPRIVGMLESDSKLTRIYGWDALRIVYPKETKIIEDHNPRESTERCRSKAAKLKAALKETDVHVPTAGSEGASEDGPSAGPS